MYLALDPSRRLSTEFSANHPYRRYTRMSVDNNADSMMGRLRPSIITHPVPDKYNMPPLSTVTENNYPYEERTPSISNTSFHLSVNR